MASNFYAYYPSGFNVRNEDKYLNNNKIEENNAA